MKTESNEKGEPTTSSQTFLDYKKVKNILYPHTINMSVGGMEFEMNVKSIQINPKYASDEFDW